MNRSEKISQYRRRLVELFETAGKKLLPDLMPPPERGDHTQASALLERGRKHYNKKNFEKAERYFRKAVLADESYPLAHYYLGLSLYKRDDATGAIKAWKRTREIAPTDPAAFKAERKIEYAQKHLNRALSELEGRARKR